MTSSEFVTYVASVLAISVPTLIYTSYVAWNGEKRAAISWRAGKLVATILGSIGIILTLMTFEKAVREINEKSKEYLMNAFLDLKSTTQSVYYENCPVPFSDIIKYMECQDYKTIDSKIRAWTTKDKEKIEIQTFNSKSLEFKRNIELIELRLKIVNDSKEMALESSLISTENRIKILVLGLVLIAISIVLSIGEAVYQLSMEIKREKSTGQLTPLRADMKMYGSQRRSPLAMVLPPPKLRQLTWRGAGGYPAARKLHLKRGRFSLVKRQAVSRFYGGE